MNQILQMIDSKCDQRGTTCRIPIKYAMLLATLCGIDIHEIIFSNSNRSHGIEDPDREKMAVCTAFLDPITAGPGNQEQVRVCRTTSVLKYPKTRAREFFDLPDRGIILPALNHSVQIYGPTPREDKNLAQGH